MIMKIYDISQEIFSAQVYPDDPKPEKKTVKSIKNGDLYNLTAFSMCAHNGTHIDAPLHFLEGGKSVDALSLESFVGMAYVVEHDGALLAKDAEEILETAKKKSSDAARRILIKGAAIVSKEAAEIFASSELILLGVESQSVGPEDAPMEVHRVLLSSEVVLLEGIRLSEVSEGIYFLSAAPLNLAGSDGAPVRAVLISDK